MNRHNVAGKYNKISSSLFNKVHVYNIALMASKEAPVKYLLNRTQALAGNISNTTGTVYDAVFVSAFNELDAVKVNADNRVSGSDSQHTLADSAQSIIENSI